MSGKIGFLTRRQFLKRNIFLALAVALLVSPLKAFGQAFRRGSNISDKEARFYSKLAG